MIVVDKNTKEIPNTIRKSIFLAGPCPRKDHHQDRTWHDEALGYLSRLGYEGHVFIPLPFGEDYVEGVHWEDRYLNLADVILFWVPRDLEELPGFTSNIEFGEWFKSGKIVLGYPEGAPKMSYLDLKARELDVPVRNTLEETVDAALGILGEGSTRVGGEAHVPLHIWQKQGFQDWLASQYLAGNTLVDAKLLWDFRPPISKKVFCWVLKVNVFVGSEGRIKSNEFVFTRSDISVILAYSKTSPSLDGIRVLCVKEFRSPARTHDGFVHELPGGSSPEEGEDPGATASHELEEETGLKIDPSRFRKRGSRQLVATLSSHKAHLYSVEISEQEMASVEGRVAGVAADTERTYVSSVLLADVLSGEVPMDWSMVGMLLGGLLGASEHPSEGVQRKVRAVLGRRA